MSFYFMLIEILLCWIFDKANVLCVFLCCMCLNVAVTCPVSHVFMYVWNIYQALLSCFIHNSWAAFMIWLRYFIKTELTH